GGCPAWRRSSLGRVKQVSEGAGARIDDRCAGVDAAQQPVQVLDMRQHWAEERVALGRLHQQGREVLHVFIVEEGFVLFDVDPYEYVFRIALRERVERRAISGAGVAPGGAIAGDHQSIVVGEAAGKVGQGSLSVEAVHVADSSDGFYYDNCCVDMKAAHERISGLPT